MLTKLTVRNFKRFGEVEIELANPVVFIGPNNSGKTSALQALALWEVGVRRWGERRKGKATPEKRPGVTISRRELIAAPVPDANLLWRNLRVRDVRIAEGTQNTKNIRIDIIVEGITEDQRWECGMEFDYANEESFYCRPLRLSEEKSPDRMPIPDGAKSVRVALLPPMSGLVASETRLDTGAIDVRVGEGRTAEVLRNLCHKVHKESPAQWQRITDTIQSLFGAQLEAPRYIAERGEIVMSYREKEIRLDLSSSGRGLQQTLLLLAYMYANPSAVLLLDEPDAHLEILRQRQIYEIITDVAAQNGNQIIAASHSEVLLNEAADRDVVVAFVGKPHRINDRGSQVAKALKQIGFEHYYQAEQTGWVLYLEGATDLAILRAFAKKLAHTKAQSALERPYVHYVGNEPPRVRTHFQGLREAVPHLQGVAIFDRLPPPGLLSDLGAEGLMWTRREIENYLCIPETLRAYAEQTGHQAYGELFARTESVHRVQTMEVSIADVERALQTLGKESPWSPNTKVSDDFLPHVFQSYFSRLGLPNVMAKKNYHELVQFVPSEKLVPEIGDKLDAIVRVADRARPMTE